MFAKTANLKSSSGLFGGWLAIYIALPFLGLIYYVATHGVGNSPGVLQAAYVSAATASITTAILVIFGLPLASYLAHSNSQRAAGIRVLIRLPLGIPPLVSGIMLLIVFGPYSIIGRIFSGRLVNSMIAIVLAQLLVEMPFVIEGSRAAFAQLDPEVFEVSSILGIPNWRTLVGVEIPLAIKPIRTAVMMGWLRAFGEFGATVLVAYHPTSLPVLIFTQFSGTGLTSAILPVGAVLLVSSVGAWLIKRIAVPSRLLLDIPGRYNFNQSAQEDLVSWQSRSDPGAISFRVAGNVGGFNLDVAADVQGKSLAITGPSGAGKSLTLRALVGLLPSLLDQVQIGELAKPKIAFVPQGQALFGHLDVMAQLAISARWSGGLQSRDAILSRIYQCSEQVGITHLLDREISTLSGGQKQRVALARAIACNPDILVLDEPFSALDRSERDRQIRFVRKLVKDLSLYLIVVTHDIEEAAFLSDSVAIVRSGTVLSSGNLSQLVRQPTSIEVAEILGYENILTGDALSGASSSYSVEDPKVYSELEAIVFRNYGHKIELALSAQSALEFHFYAGSDGLVITGTLLVQDYVDLGNQAVVILKASDLISLEFKTVFDRFEIATGSWVDVTIELNPGLSALIAARAGVSG